MPIGLPEFADNREKRCPVILLVDTSASMSGDPIEQLNRGLSAFKEDALRDTQASLSIEVAIVTFGSQVKTVQDFVGIQTFQPHPLETQGATPMGEALVMAMDLVEKRKQSYKDSEIRYFRPWIFLITDGAPTDHWQTAAQRLREEESQNRFLFFAVGVEGANFDVLSQISPSNRPPVSLKGLDFREMFVWLSGSMKRITNSKSGEMLSLPPIDGWGQINPG